MSFFLKHDIIKPWTAIVISYQHNNNIIKKIHEISMIFFEGGVSTVIFLSISNFLTTFKEKLCTSLSMKFGSENAFEFVEPETSPSSPTCSRFDSGCVTLTSISSSFNKWAISGSASIFPPRKTSVIILIVLLSKYDLKDFLPWLKLLLLLSKFDVDSPPWREPELLGRRSVHSEISIAKLMRIFLTTGTFLSNLRMPVSALRRLTWASWKNATISFVLAAPYKIFGFKNSAGKIILFNEVK